MKVAYYDRKLQPISQSQWRELCQDEGYSILKRFRDDRVHIEARWIGKLENPQNYFPYLRPVFAVLVFNRGSDGQWVQDPAHGQRFHDEKKLIAYYEEFVLNWTKSEMKDGELQEVGNELEAPAESMALGPKTTAVKNVIGVPEELASVGAW